RRRHTRSDRDWSSDVCSSDLRPAGNGNESIGAALRPNDRCELRRAIPSKGIDEGRRCCKDGSSVDLKARTSRLPGREKTPESSALRQHAPLAHGSAFHPPPRTSSESP